MNLPLTALMDDAVLLAFRADCRDLESECGGPVRMIVRKRYYESAKWLKGIRLVEDDEHGF